MSTPFDFLNLQFFTKASVYPGSLGTFRYRFARTGWIGESDATIQVWVYENTSFELAQQVETQIFPWNEEGVEKIKAWLNDRLAERGTQPYFIPYTAPGKEKKE